MSTPIDLSRLPLPDVIEPTDFEALFAQRKTDFLAQFDSDTAAAMEGLLELESEPLTKLLQENCYREMILRQRINEAAQAGMLAAATGADIDNIAARYETLRKDGESDEQLRARTQMAFYQVAAAGPANRYRRVALDAHVDVLAVDAWQQSPGVVRVAVLARALVKEQDTTPAAVTLGRALFGEPEGDGVYVIGTAGTEGFDAATARLTADDVQPLGVALHVTAPEAKPYTVSAAVVVPRGPDPASVLASAASAHNSATQRLAGFRIDIHRAALIDALMVDGARTVELTSPAQDLPVSHGQIAVCTATDITVSVRDD